MEKRVIDATFPGELRPVRAAGVRRRERLPMKGDFCSADATGRARVITAKFTASGFQILESQGLASAPSSRIRE
jgi:hypothetical protein